HLVHVIDRANGQTTYLDGRVAHAVVDAGTTIQSVGNVDSTASWTIGQDPVGNYTSGGASVSENVDDIAVFRRALDRLEVAQIYLAGVSNSPAKSFTGAPLPPVSIQGLAGNRTQVTWTCGGLQAAPAPTGPWTNVPA